MNPHPTPRIADHASPAQVIEVCMKRAVVLVASEADPNGPLHRTMFKAMLACDEDVLRKASSLQWALLPEIYCNKYM